MRARSKSVCPSLRAVPAPPSPGRSPRACVSPPRARAQTRVHAGHGHEAGQTSGEFGRSGHLGPRGLRPPSDTLTRGIPTPASSETQVTDGPRARQALPNAAAGWKPGHRAAPGPERSGGDARDCDVAPAEYLPHPAPLGVPPGVGRPGTRGHVPIGSSGGWGEGRGQAVQGCIRRADGPSERFGSPGRLPLPHRD